MAKKQLKPTDLEKQFQKQVDILNGYLKELKSKENLTEPQLNAFIQSKNKEWTDYRLSSALLTVHNVETSMGSSTPYITEYEFVQEELAELKEEYGSCIGFRQYFDATAESYYDSSDAKVTEIFVNTRYITLNKESNDKINAIAMDQTKDWLAKELSTITEKKISRYNLDCKIIELWKTDKIDFDTLCTIISTNCKI